MVGLELVVVILVLVGAMVLHELAHGVVALWLGDETAKNEGRLTLNPLAHVDPVLSILMPLVMLVMRMPVFGGAKPVPVNQDNLKGKEYGMALVALAGPLTNFLLALVAFLVGHWTGWIKMEVGELVIGQIVMINLGLMAFNLLPIPPLDGSRILYALMPDGIRTMMQRMEESGWMMMVIILLVSSAGFSTVIMKIISTVLRGFFWLVGA